MFEVKVKTLDGRTHEFNVEDELTVGQFKEIIHTKMEIESDRQRLLYQGRVLQDDRTLISYNVAGNVMHLVTRPPPHELSQNRVLNESTSSDENSDINREQIRNILGDVLANINDYNNVSVQNDGNRMDITVNIPSSGNPQRLSLARLRNNYCHRLLRQSRGILNHLNTNEPSESDLQADYQCLRQANPHELSESEERITEVNSNPLPIGNLADLLDEIRNLWRDSESSIIRWQELLRSNQVPNGRTAQQIHDYNSRLLHLMSHIMHITSDYLVEFEHNNNILRSEPTSRVTTATNTTVDNSTPLTAGCGESSNIDTNDPSPVSATVPPLVDGGASASSNMENGRDRNRYLYVFSEVPAQLVQVRVDMETPMGSSFRTINPIRTRIVPLSTQTTGTTTNDAPTESTIAGPTPTIESTHNNNVTITTPTTAAQTTAVPTTTAPPLVPPQSASSIPLRATMRTGATNSTNSIPNLLGSAAHHHTNGDTIDPYLRCHSRHFQSTNLRSGSAVLSYGAIRPSHRTGTTNGSSVNLLRNPSIISTTIGGNSRNNTTTNTSSTANVTSGSANMTNPLQHILSNIMNSVLNSTLASAAANTTRSTTTPTTGNTPVSQTINMPNINIITGANNTRMSLLSMMPDMGNILANYRILNDIMRIVFSNLTLPQLLHISADATNNPANISNPTTNAYFNCLRGPLRQLFMDRNRESVIGDLNYDLLQASNPLVELVNQMRQEPTGDNMQHLNHTYDVEASLARIYQYHSRHIVELVCRSPTDSGFGELLITSLNQMQDHLIVLLEMLCNHNTALRQNIVQQLFLQLTSNLNVAIRTSNQNSMLQDILNEYLHSMYIVPDNLAQLEREIEQNYLVLLSDSQTSTQNVPTTNQSNSMNLEQDNHPITTLDEHVSQLCCMKCPADSDVVIPAPPSQTSPPTIWTDILTRDQSSRSRSPSFGEQTSTFSDAYLSGQPAKRRKLTLYQRHNAMAETPHQLFTEVLNQAVSSSNVVGATPTLIAPSRELVNSFEHFVSSNIHQTTANNTAIRSQATPQSPLVKHLTNASSTPTNKTTPNKDN